MKLGKIGNKLILILIFFIPFTTFGQYSDNIQETISLGDLLKQGGWAMWPLGLFSFLLIFLIIKNALMLREKGMLRPDLHIKLQNSFRDGNISEVIEICKKNDSLITSVLSEGIERISENNYDAAEVSDAIEEAGNEQMVIYMKSINYLSIIGGTAPMLGLLGTVSGMIKAFSVMSQGGMGDPSKLAGSIGEALITTATGLVIAIPAMIFYFIFKNNFLKTMSTMSRKISSFLSLYKNQLHEG